MLGIGRRHRCRRREIVEVEEPLGTVKALDPIMKSIAQQGMRIRPRR
ncbi:uvrD/Rep family helicase domain protein [Mycobacterium xenopi 3993]|nr:uvrD/Rep family helicase domain protein [Mycobacterium xenopi 3993]